MQFRCGQCGDLFTVEGDGAGGPIVCPRCGHAVRAADAVDASAGAAPQTAVEEAAGFAEIAKLDLARKIHIRCGACNKHLTVSRRWAGRYGKCPACRGTILIPIIEEEEDASLSRILAAREAAADAISVSDAGEMIEDGEIEEIKEFEALRKNRRFVTRTIVLMFALAGGICAGILIRAGLSGGPSHDTPGPVAERPGVTPRSNAGRGVEPATHPVAPPTVGPVNTVVHQPVKLPPAPAAVCRILGSRSSLFAYGGYRPARPDRLYVRIDAEMKAADKPVELDSGDDVTLVLAGQSLRALGVARKADLPGRAADRRKVSIAPGESHSLTFVFDAPAVLEGEATLRIRGIGDVPVGRFERPAPVGPGDMIGTYAEKPPRNLQPLLRDPIMAAVQSAADPKLVISRGNDGLNILIPSAGVHGVARPGDGGLCEVELRGGQGVLPCKLRFADSGKLAVLYLSAEPYHQLTYERQ